MVDIENSYNSHLVRDPLLASCRIFIGNLPNCTKEELESICSQYGKVVGWQMHKNYGFVQYETEEIANKASTVMNKSIFKRSTITVRNAASKQPPNNAKKLKMTPNTGNQGQMNNSNQNASSSGVDANNCNDCEIIVVDRNNTKYAEYIEERLKHLDLRVDVLFPNAEVPLGKVLANISARGCLYAVLVTQQHEEHNSITVNILYGQPAEHRNMPLEDALNLIGDDFSQQMSSRLKDARSNMPLSSMSNSTAKAVGGSAVGVPSVNDRHPDAVQLLLNKLADNLLITVPEYDSIIKYLQERRDLLHKSNVNEIQTAKQIDPEIELQKKILNILNKPSVTEMHYDILYPNLQAVKNDPSMMELLKDVRVLNALDSLLNTNIAKTVEEYMKF